MDLNVVILSLEQFALELAMLLLGYLVSRLLDRLTK